MEGRQEDEQALRSSGGAADAQHCVVIQLDAHLGPPGGGTAKRWRRCRGLGARACSCCMVGLSRASARPAGGSAWAVAAILPLHSLGFWPGTVATTGQSHNPGSSVAAAVAGACPTHLGRRSGVHPRLGNRAGVQESSYTVEMTVHAVSACTTAPQRPCLASPSLPTPFLAEPLSATQPAHSSPHERRPLALPTTCSSASRLSLTPPAPALCLHCPHLFAITRVVKLAARLCKIHVE